MRTSLRKPSQYDRILEVLADRKQHTAAELYRTGCVLHSRISVLRDRGYVIDVTRTAGVGAESYLYRLVATPEPGNPQGVGVSALDTASVASRTLPAEAVSIPGSGVSVTVADGCLPDAGTPDFQLSFLDSAAAPRARAAA